MTWAPDFTNPAEGRVTCGWVLDKYQQIAPVWTLSQSSVCGGAAKSRRASRNSRRDNQRHNMPITTAEEQKVYLKQLRSNVDATPEVPTLDDKRT